jgi:hypothetical protein
MSDSANPYSSPQFDVKKTSESPQDVPLWTYRERRHLFNPREYSLLADRLLLKSKEPSGRSEFTFVLATLRPAPNRIFLRRNLMLLLLIFFPLTMIVVSLAGKNDPWADPIVIISVILCGAAWLSALIFRRPTEFAQFVNSNGTIAFDVARAGPDRDHFDEFVVAIEHEIRRSQQSHHPQEPKE